MEMYTETELMRRAMKSAYPRNKLRSCLWVVVMDVFAVGRTQAHAICEHYGYDPDEQRINPSFIASRF